MKKVSEDQLQKAREIRGKQQGMQSELGALYVSMKDIEIRQSQLLEELRASGSEIQELMTELREEFGEGSLNLETGEFSESE